MSEDPIPNTYELWKTGYEELQALRRKLWGLESLRKELTERERMLMLECVQAAAGKAWSEGR
ncbi:MAG TPA: hypothetical protein VGK73_30650 [Polyangiaceae bacterium]